MRSDFRFADELIQRRLEQEQSEEAVKPKTYSLTDHEPYGKAHAHLVALRERLAGALAPAEARLQEAQDRVRRAERAVFEAEARAFQEDREPDPAPLQVLERARLELGKAEAGLAEAKRKAAALELAVQRQETAVKALEEAARQHVRVQARQDHGPAVKRLVGAAVAFAEALRVEQAIVIGAAQILGTNHGLARGLPPEPMELLRRSPLERWIQRLREAGYEV